jgi:actin-like ATPase involved in cell morphogenesis
LSDVPSSAEEHHPTVYRLGDDYTGIRVIMKHLGLDVGTKTIVVSFKGDDGKSRFISEINGYWPFERATPFVENMLNDPKKKRSDGTERPARWIKLENNRIIVLGRDAEEFAYAKNDTLLRPMAEGGISPDEEAMTVLSSIIHGLINMAENDLGKFDEEVKICYCTTAPAINKDSNIDYHQRVVNMILENYETKAKKTVNNIKESHAIVLDMSQDATGIGISWGAGTVTVSYVKYGMEVYSFCWVGAGDWIDTQVAMRHGYDPELSKTRKKVAKETPTTVSRRKMEVDLTPGKEPEDRLGMDIVLHYDVLISKVIEGIVTGFQEHEAEARIEEGVNIFMAGGTSSPRGFAQRVIKKLEETDLPFSVGEVKRSNQPLYCVADGLLKAAEMF